MKIQKYGFNELTDVHGEHFRPTARLREMASKGETFFK
jgi:hypothetical protein